MAARMHTHLLEGLGVERVTLAMRPDPEAAPAHAAYAAWGYRQVGHWRPAADEPVSHIMLLTLPVTAQGAASDRVRDRDAGVEPAYACKGRRGVCAGPGEPGRRAARALAARPERRGQDDLAPHSVHGAVAVCRPRRGYATVAWRMGSSAWRVRHHRPGHPMSKVSWRPARRRGAAGDGQPARVGLLRERGFRLYWSAQSVSLVGDEINILAIPLAAVVLLDAGAAEMGWLTAAALLPSLLLSIPGGAWADRQANRRRAMIVADVGRFTAVASVPMAYACGSLTLVHLYVTEFVVGVLTVLSRVCKHHVYASVVAAERYVDGNALLSGSRSVAAVAGPSTGGALLQALSAPFALLVDAITYLVSAACLGRIRGAREAPPAPRGEGGLADGLRWVGAHRTPALLLAGVAMLSLCQTLTATLFVLYGTTELGLTPAAIGAVFAVFGLGGLAGAYAAPRVVRRIGIGPAIVTGFLGLSLPLLLVPLADGPAPLVIATLAAAHLGAGCGVAVLDISTNSYLIAVIPPTLRSRVMGVVQTANFGVRPIGAVLAGTLGTALGLRPTLWIGTAGAVLSVLWVAASELPRVRELPENAEQRREEHEEAGV